MGKYFIHDTDNIVIATGYCIDGNEIYEEENLPTGQFLKTGEVDWNVYSYPSETYGITIEDIAQLLFVKIQNEKCRKRDAGFLVGETLFDSDSNARLSYQEFSFKIKDEPAYIAHNWKASSGQWVTMDATLFNQIMQAGEEHTATCFAWQKEKEQEVQALLDAGNKTALENYQII